MVNKIALNGLNKRFMMWWKNKKNKKGWQLPYNYRTMILGGEEMKNSRIEVRVSQEEKEKIDKEAEKENLKTATFVRKVVLDYIENKK